MKEGKICFIIMPISDNSQYAEGHFQRVYNHLIIPACEKAGFKPIRADDVINTNYIALDVIRKIIESDLAICDLSSQNPNVLYELGIRQAFNKPVALIKDKQTKRIFDIQGFRDFEYDKDLRVDRVENEINQLSEILLSTYEESDNDINSLVTLLGLSPAKIGNTTEISRETELILNSISTLDKRINQIEENSLFRKKEKFPMPKTKFYGGDIPLPNNPVPEPPPIKYMEFPENVGEPIPKSEFKKLKNGDEIYHQRFGYGRVLNIDEPSDGDKTFKGAFDFKESGKKRLVLDYARLYKVL